MTGNLYEKCMLGKKDNIKIDIKETDCGGLDWLNTWSKGMFF
jgi:hypothetical protein